MDDVSFEKKLEIANESNKQTKKIERKKEKKVTSHTAL